MSLVGSMEGDDRFFVDLVLRWRRWGEIGGLWHQRGRSAFCGVSSFVPRLEHPRWDVLGTLVERRHRSLTWHCGQIHSFAQGRFFDVLRERWVDGTQFLRTEFCSLAVQTGGRRRFYHGLHGGGGGRRRWSGRWFHPPLAVQRPPLRHHHSLLGRIHEHIAAASASAAIRQSGSWRNNSIDGAVGFELPLVDFVLNGGIDNDGLENGWGAAGEILFPFGEREAGGDLFGN